jgi:hypothetical protein
MGFQPPTLALSDPQFYQGVPYLLARYFHIVCTALIVGGTLFFEWVVPVAIKDLQTPEQLAVFGRARWFFRRIVWVAAVLLLISGVIGSVQHWDSYKAPEPEEVSVTFRVGWWWVAHAASGVLALLIALMLTSLPVPPSHPVGWMRANLIVLLTVIFFASVTEHIRIERTQQMLAEAGGVAGIGFVRGVPMVAEEVVPGSVVIPLGKDTHKPLAPDAGPAATTAPSTRP